MITGICIVQRMDILPILDSLKQYIHADSEVWLIRYAGT